MIYWQYTFTKSLPIGSARDVHYQEMSVNMILLLNTLVLWYGHYYMHHMLICISMGLHHYFKLPDLNGPVNYIKGSVKQVPLELVLIM